MEKGKKIIVIMIIIIIIMKSNSSNYNSFRNVTCIVLKILIYLRTMSNLSS